jgi:enoyl-CoA hydratase
MIMTGRPVGAAEALAFGLADRVVDDGTARSEAERLAAQIAAFPPLCMRSDRRSAYDSFGLTEDEAIRHETRLGLKVIASGETRAGAARFAGGEGRHGKFS